MIGLNDSCNYSNQLGGVYTRYYMVTPRYGFNFIFERKKKTNNLLTIADTLDVLNDIFFCFSGNVL